MEPDYIIATMKKVIEDYFTDCLVNAEFSVDKTVFDKYNLDKADMENQIRHQITCKLVEFVDSKGLKLSKRENSIRVTLTTTLGIFTVKELESLISISAAILGERKK